MELISLVRPEHVNTLSRRLRPRGWYKSVIDSEHHDCCTVPRLSFKSQMQALQLLVTHRFGYYYLEQLHTAWTRNVAHHH